MRRAIFVSDFCLQQQKRISCRKTQATGGVTPAGQAGVLVKYSSRMPAPHQRFPKDTHHTQCVPLEKTRVLALRAHQWRKRHATGRVLRPVWRWQRDRVWNDTSMTCNFWRLCGYACEMQQHITSSITAPGVRHLPPRVASSPP